LPICGQSIAQKRSLKVEECRKASSVASESVHHYHSIRARLELSPIRLPPMGPERAQEISERDQLWASLRALRPDIERLAAGDPAAGEWRDPLIKLLARIVIAELDFRAQSSAPDAGA
jgi:hypothetical protein